MAGAEPGEGIADFLNDFGSSSDDGVLPAGAADSSSSAAFVAAPAPAAMPQHASQHRPVMTGDECSSVHQAGAAGAEEQEDEEGGAWGALLRAFRRSEPPRRVAGHYYTRVEDWRATHTQARFWDEALSQVCCCCRCRNRRRRRHDTVLWERAGRALTLRRVSCLCVGPWRVVGCPLRRMYGASLLDRPATGDSA
jgi:hypothetical protein